MTLNPKRPKVPHMCLSIHESQNSMFCSTTIRFRDTGHFETSAPNDPKMTLDPTRSNIPHVCTTSVPNPYFQFVSLCNRPFCSYKPLQTTAPNDSQITLNTTRPKVPHICDTSVPESQILVLFALRPAICEIQAC